MLGGGNKREKEYIALVGFEPPNPCIQNPARDPLDQLLYGVTVAQHT